MAEFRFQFDNGGRVPCDVKKTLGTIEILKVLEPVQVFEDGQPTGEVAERPVECFSETADAVVLVTFPPEVDLTGLKAFDAIELPQNSTDVVPWASIDPNARNARDATSGIKVKAAKFKRLGSSPTPAPTQPQKTSAEEKDNKGAAK